MKSANKLIKSLTVLIILFLPSLLYAAAMNNYCITPPFVVAGVNPNLLLMLDNSASQYDLEYLNPTGMFCYDNSYSNSTGAYSGYFNPNRCYTSNGVTYATDTTIGNTTFSQFTDTGPAPCSFSGCSYATNYFCVSSGSPPTFSASGKFLNWLSASKMDVQKQILTGGKYDQTNQLLIGETRGCVGYSFVKEVPDADYVTRQGSNWITFGVRGDISADIKIPATGGTTRIDIYQGSNYNNAACQAAVTDWINGGQGQNSRNSDTAQCLNTTSGTSTPRATWNHALQTCWSCQHTPCQLGDIGTGDIQRIENDCGSLTTAQMASLQTSDPMYVCLRDTDKNIYIGACYPSPTDDCVAQQFVNYCQGLQVGEVVDPSSGAQATGTLGNIPANLVDGGLLGQLGTPIGTYHVRVSNSVPKGTCSVTTTTSCYNNSDCPSGEQCYPSGLIQQFQNQIRFGAMTFRTYGSKTECSTPNSMILYTCTYTGNLDGGRVISYIGAGYCSVTASQACIANSDCPTGETCVPSVGDHTSGLINTIDSVQAATWTPFSETFYDATGYFAQRSNLRINSSSGNEDFLIDASHNPIQYKCQKNNILIVTDGMSTADLNPSVTGLVSGSTCGGSCNNFTGFATPVDTSVNSNIKYAGSRNVADLSYIAQHRNINNFSTTPVNASDSVTTHVVYTGIGTTYSSNLLDSYSLMYATAANGGGTFQNPSDPSQLYAALQQAFQTIAATSSSGTAASVLASGEGSGANLIQALFYPTHSIGGTQITWTGSLQNFWYYIDPLLGNSSIREDTVNDFKLNLIDDYIMHFRFPNTVTDQNTVADLYSDANGDGIADSSTPTGTKYLDEYIDPSNKIKYLWEAGKLLWSRSSLTRNIYTYDGTNMITIPQTTSPIDAGSTLLSLLNVGGDVNKANAIMRYVRGEDTPFSPAISGFTPTYRSRTVTIGGTSNTWKLGDIITSTPKIGSWIPLGTYHKTYSDTTYGPLGYDPQLTDPVDTTKFITTSGYKNRGIVFVGANDGMLHAFKLGTIELLNDKYNKAQLCDSRTSCSTTTLGKEIWAYIPKHALPYLQYLADPNYCHLYYVDEVPTIVDVSIGANDTGNPTDTKDATSWRTILIGGMRYGGACNDSSSSYDVQTPVPGSPPGSGAGYSSYFALDITDTLANPDNPSLYPPKVLWEFSNETIANSSFSGDLTPGSTWVGGLGFSTSGPAIVRVGAAKDSSGNPLNGRWFAVFGSGPTGPIDSTSHQFKGYSDQPLKVYVMDLRGPSYGFWRLMPNPSIPNAFAGSLLGAPIDLDQNNSAAPGYYQDDALYFGYTKAEQNPITSGTRWTLGGVLRLVTKENTDPSQWSLSRVMDNTGPVTAAVGKLQNYKVGSEALWLFFGTGRYYYKIGSQIDDSTSTRAIRGVKDPCFNHDTSHYYLKLDPNCTTSVSDSSLGDVTSDSTNATSSGWRISLDSCTDASGNIVSCTGSSVVYKAERLTTDPVPTPIGAVFFTTVEPTADVCQFGGVTHLWAVKYSTGGAVNQGILRGRALIQVSTGAISEQDISSAFTQKQDQGAASGTVLYRRTAATQGLASSEKPQIAVPPKPINKILHMRER